MLTLTMQQSGGDTFLLLDGVCSIPLIMPCCCGEPPRIHRIQHLLNTFVDGWNESKKGKKTLID